MKLLIVDDSAEMRRVIRSFVRDDCECYECDDGAQALSAYARHRPDWVLMDIKMKEMDGLAATRAIKATYPEARIVIVTNYDDADLREAAFEAGACEYVLKDDLLRIRLILTRRAQAR